MALLDDINTDAVMEYLKARAARGQAEALSALAAGLPDGGRLEVRKALSTELTTVRPHGKEPQ